jgi:hypothetical protein
VETAVAVEEDEGDDLPQPGRAWTGPTLAEAMKGGPVMVAAPAEVVARENSNVELVDANDLSALWGKLMELLKNENRPSLASIVEQGELVGVDEYQATIRYSADRQTFFNLMGRNGKKELVGEAISRLIGRAVGVKLELDAKTSAKAEAATERLPQRAVAARAVQQQVEMPVQQTAARPTAEQMTEAQKRPLVKALMEKFDASIVRISEE